LTRASSRSIFCLPFSGLAAEGKWLLECSARPVSPPDGQILARASACAWVPRRDSLLEHVEPGEHRLARRLASI
jgi:hypothetical protein